MAIIREFSAVRPDLTYIDSVAALPYDVYSSQEAREVVVGNPYSFLHIDRAEIDLPVGTDLYSKEVYQKARSTMDDFISRGVFIQDSKPGLYIYRLTMNGRAQTGLVCCSSIDDYLDGTIKKHELTREDKEQDRINHVDTCDANTGPIFLTYNSQDLINKIIDTWTDSTDKTYDFVSNDEIRHEVWIIDNHEIIMILKELFMRVESTYIADGHHRAASAVKVGLKRRKEYPDYTGEEEFNYFLSVLFPHDQLYIMDYNRVVKDTNGLTMDELVESLGKNFTVELIGKDAYKPAAKGEIGMYLTGSWYKLTINSDLLAVEDPVSGLDVSILQEYVLKPILGIKDIRTDKRIDFVGGIRGLSELERRCSMDMTLAFAMYPTSIEELMKISDAGLLMPPKSTWFEPKLRSGIFIHKLS